MWDVSQNHNSNPRRINQRALIMTLRNESGSLLISVFILSAILMGVLTATVDQWSSLLRASKLVQRHSQVEAVGNNLDRIIRDPLVLNASLFEPTCLANALDTAFTNPNPTVPELNQIYNTTTPANTTCLVHNQRPSRNALAGPDAGANYFPVDIYLPDDGNRFALDVNGNLARRILGTYKDPVFYNSRGEICYEPAADTCEIMAYAMYKVKPAGDCDGSLGHCVEVQYRTQKVNPVSIGVAQTDPSDRPFTDTEVNPVAKTLPTDIAAGVPSRAASFETLLGKINGRGDPAKTEVCPDSAMAAQGMILIGYNTVSGGPICRHAFNVKPCDQSDEWFIGYDALGNPRCGGDRSPCPDGQVLVGYESGGSGAPEKRCVSAQCNTVGNASFSYVSPNATQPAHFDCHTVTKDNSCPGGGHALFTITNNGRLRCATN